MVELAQQSLFEQGVSPPTSPSKELSELVGTVTRILYQRGIWGVILLQRANGKVVKAKGKLFPLTEQSEITLKGRWIPDERNPGEELFDADEIEIAALTSRRGLITKLGELPHLGKHRAAVVVEVFGEDAQELLRILRQEPDRVAARIPGISDQRARMIAMEIENGWGSEITRDVQLLTHLPQWVVDKALKKWPGPPVSKQNALEILYRDPYRLIELSNVGFKRADKAARDVGIGLDDQRRHVAALQFLIQAATQNDGHTWLKFSQCVDWARKEQIDGIRQDEFQRAADIGIEQGYLETDPDEPEWLTTLQLAKGEEIIAQKAQRLSYHYDAMIVDLTDKYGLNEQQAEAVQLAQTHRMLVLTGGPGTGKTYTLQAILDAMEQQFERPDFRGWGKIYLCAPTGKAARRMWEVTGKPAATVHQTLGYKHELDSFEFGMGNRLPVSLVVCDEASMLDTRLAAQLFAAIPEDGRLLLVGDVDQLPSVGPGKILNDLIESKRVPVVRLTQTMRQAEDSAIITNAHALIHGKDLHIDNQRYKDFKFFEVPVLDKKREERLQTAQSLLWAHETVRNRLGFDLGDIQVLSPQKGGEIGCVELNRRLREALNPPSPDKAELPVPHQKRSLRVGDRVIQTKNDYDLGVMNGQIGELVEIERPGPTQQGRERGFAVVAFEGGQYVRIRAADLKHLQLAYAITVHKSQGSEWPVVIIPISTSHAKTLSRRLLYTAITRGKEVVVLVGTEKALRYAQRNVQDAKRQTKLCQLLQEGPGWT